MYSRQVSSFREKLNSRIRRPVGGGGWGRQWSGLLERLGPTLTRWLCVGGSLPGRPPRGSMPSHLMDEEQNVPELLALGAGLDLGGGTYRSMDQNPQAPPLHPILHPRWPGSCWEGRWREPTGQRRGPHSGARERGAELVALVAVASPASRRGAPPQGPSIFHPGRWQGAETRNTPIAPPAPTEPLCSAPLQTPLTGSLVFDEEQLKPLLEGVLVDVELHLDPGG